MPLSIVGATQAVRSGSIITLPVPSGVQDGDLLLVGVHQDSGSEAALTPPAGWTKRNFFSLTGGHGLHIYFRVANAEPASYTWTDTVSAVAFCLAIRGQDPTTPFDVADGAPAQINGSSIATNSITTQTADALLIAIACQNVGVVTSFTPPSGFTEQADAAVGWAAITCATNSAATVGSYGPYTFVSAQSSNSAGWLTAIRPASSGTTYTQAFTANLTVNSGTGKQGQATKAVALGLATSVSRLSTRGLSGALILASATAKATARGLNSALNLGATLARQPSRILTAPLALGTAFSALRTYLRQFSATLTLGVSLGRGAGRGFASSLTLGSALGRSIGRRFLAALSAVSGFAQQVIGMIVRPPVIVDQIQFTSRRVDSVALSKQRDATYLRVTRVDSIDL